MAIVYPNYPSIPQPTNPLEKGLSGLMEGWEAGRKKLKDKQGVDAAYDVYSSAPGRQAPNLGFLSGLGGQTAAGMGGGVPAPGTTTGGATPSKALTGDSGRIYGDFIGTVKAGDPALGLAGVTNPYGLAAVASTGRAESGYSPGNIHRQWSDPSESGKAGNAGGIMSWRAERLANMRAFASKVGDDPNRPSAATQAKFFLSEDPSLVAKLNAAQSPEEAQQLMNRAWAFAGYDRPGGEAARRTAMARSYYANEFGRGGASAAIEAQAPQRPVEVASIEPGAGMDTALAYSPTGPSAAAGAGPSRVPIPTARPEDLTYTTSSPTAPGNAGAAPAGASAAGAPPMLDVPSLVSAVAGGQVSGPNLTREQFSALLGSDQTRQLAIELFRSKVTGDPDAAMRAMDLGIRLEGLNYNRQRQASQDALAAEDRAYGRTRDAAQDARLDRQLDITERNANLKSTGFRDLSREEAAQRGLPPGAYQVGPDNRVYEIGKSGQTITVNTDGGTNGALLKKGNEELGKGLADTVAAGRTARRNIAQIDQLDKLLAGAGTGIGAVAKQYLGRIGIKTDGLDEIQAADALINQLIPAQRPPGSGTMSDADIVMFRNSIPSLMNQPGGNALIIKTMRDIATYDAQMGDIASRVLRGELSQQDGDNMMATLANPLADFSAPTGAAPAAPAYRTEGGVPVGGAVEAGGGVPVGRTATNPQTGKKIRWNGSIWEEM